ncbi:hypothetical protein [Methylobacterium trifolii]|uniref:Uncharacterized protein n=1 Tax=Methylobacterium trifolii TaxID=1003092 RepID=A0ABQ4U3S2_9HYPH|nr:hypothetical protein [Methylobacterium trifolii]GJE60735.1 hypothetical protein MPOCJGCO_2851 [Methylobacterium trifolii]
MSAAGGRRGFLRGLVSLPLIGGGVTLIGNPSAAAVPVMGGMVATYLAWLHFEMRYASWGCNGRNFVPMMNHGAVFHGRPGEHPADSARAALHRAPIILAAAGCRLTCPEAEEQCGEMFAPSKWQEGGR